MICVDRFMHMQNPVCSHLIEVFFFDTVIQKTSKMK